MKLRSMLCASLLAVLCLILLVSCGASPKAPAQSDPAGESEISSASADETGENPARSVAGLYAESKTGAGSVEITLNGEDGAFIVVRWKDSSGTDWIWNMSGTYNEKKNTIRYEDCIRIANTQDAANGTVSETLYRDGKGSIRFENGELYWTDEEEHFADGLVFVRV